MVVEALKAAYGEALVVKASNQESPFTIVIDGGPKETEDKIADYYLSLGYIDLLILTHYDDAFTLASDLSCCKHKYTIPNIQINSDN